MCSIWVRERTYFVRETVSAVKGECQAAGGSELNNTVVRSAERGASQDESVQVSA